MSAGVSDQRMKGQGNQVANGSKEQLGAGEGATGSEEFEPWRTQQQQQQNSAGHTAAYGTNAPISSGTDLYNMSTAVSGYYGSGGSYPYQAYGVGDGTWSNGTDPMPFLSGYPHDSYSMDGMFGPSTTFSTPTAAFTGQPSSFNYFTHSNGDYNTWGSQLSSQRKDDYYYRDPSQNMYATMPDNSLKGMEHAMQSLDLKSAESKELGGQKKAPSWASIASQPAKPQVTLSSTGLKKKGPGMPPGPIVPGKHNMDIGTWDTNKSTPPQIPLPVVSNVVPPKNTLPPNVTQAPPASNVRMGWSAAPPPQPQVPRQPQTVTQAPPPRGPQHPMPPAAAYQPQSMMPPMMPAQVPAGSHIQGMMPPPPMQMMMPQAATTGAQPAAPTAPAPQHPVLDELMSKHKYNPTDFDLTAPNARFFVIKSYSEDDIHRSIKYEIWCSTEHGNKRLDGAFQERQEKQGYIYLFFSVNGSGHFCGMAQMLSQVDYNSSSSVWSQDKWKGQFKVRWIYVKDVPNVQLRHIRLENNDNKPVTNSRDAQEVPHARGLQVLRIMHSYRHSTSIFDDFIHYEKRQEEEDTRKVPPAKEPHQHQDGPNNRDNSHGGGPGRDYHNRDSRDHRGGPRDRNYDRDQRDDRNDPRDHRDNHRNDRHERPEGHRGGYRNDRNDRGDRNGDRQDRGGDRSEHHRGDRNDYGRPEQRDYHKQDRDHREHREHRGGGRGGRGGHHHNTRN